MFGKVTDPVCRMKIKKKDAMDFCNYNGKDYYFCSESCKKYFDKNLEKYMKPKRRTIDVAELECGHCKQCIK